MKTNVRLVRRVVAGLGMVMVALTTAWAQAPGAPTAPAVAGTVKQYLLSPHGEVEGLLLSDGTVVKFPKHLGAALASSVKAGDPVNIIGFLGPTTPHGRAMKALTITNTASGQTIVDEPRPSRPLPPEHRGLTRSPLSVSGSVAQWLVNPKGEVDGLVLSGGEQVKFKPHRGASLAAQLGPGAGPVTVSGLGARTAFGTGIEADSLTAGGQTFWLRGKGKKGK